MYLILVIGLTVGEEENVMSKMCTSFLSSLSKLPKEKETQVSRNQKSLKFRSFERKNISAFASYQMNLPKNDNKLLHCFFCAMVC